MNTFALWLYHKWTEMQDSLFKLSGGEDHEISFEWTEYQRQSGAYWADGGACPGGDDVL